MKTKTTKLFFKLGILLLLISLTSAVFLSLSFDTKTADAANIVGTEPAPFYTAVNGKFIVGASDGGTPANPKALFQKDGTVNQSVLKELKDVLDAMNAPYSDTIATTYKHATALDFSDYAKGGKTYGAVYIKPFDTKTSGGNTQQHAFTQKWWQLVYRSVVDSGTIKDVVTIYMTEHYMTRSFQVSGSFPTGGYASSDIRSAEIIPMYEWLKNTAGFSNNLDNYTVAPNAVPGLWQTDTAQTGNSSSGAGPSGQSGWYGSSNFATQNGLNNTDRLWIPSNYEVIYKGNNKESVTSVSYVNDYSISAATTGNHATRTGLWQLNCFDRANSLGVNSWLRSGRSDSSDYALMVNLYGDCSNATVTSTSLGVRPALHLNMTALAALLTPAASYSASFASDPAGSSRVSADGVEETASIVDKPFGHFTLENRLKLTFDTKNPTDYYISDITITDVAKDSGSTILIEPAALIIAADNDPTWQTISDGGSTIICHYRAWYKNGPGDKSEIEVELYPPADDPVDIAIVATTKAREEISGVFFETIDNVTYNGSPYTPEPTATGLTKDVDFTFNAGSYANNTNAGQAEITITGIGKYKGTTTVYFTIDPIDLATTNNLQFTFAAMTYDGTARTPVLSSFKINGVTYTITGTSWQAVTNVADTTNMTACTDTNYTNWSSVTGISTGMAEFNISTADVSFDTLIYNGKLQQPTATVKFSSSGATISGTWSQVTNFGEDSTFTLDGSETEGNFTGLLKKQPIQKYTIATDGSTIDYVSFGLTYNGSAQNPIDGSGGTVYMIASDGTSQGNQITGTWSNVTNVGSQATFTIASGIQGNFTNSSFTITMAISADMAKADPTINGYTGLTFTYGDQLLGANLASKGVTVAGVGGATGLSGTLTWEHSDGSSTSAEGYIPLVSESGVGKFQLRFVPADGTNYSTKLVANIQITVNQRELAFTWQWSDGASISTSKVYKGSDWTVNAVISNLVKRNGTTDDVVSFTYSNNTNTNADTYTATITGKTGADSGNYALPGVLTQSYTIAPLDISTAAITFGGDFATLTYNDTSQNPTGTKVVKANGLDVGGTWSWVTNVLDTTTFTVTDTNFTGTHAGVTDLSTGMNQADQAALNFTSSNTHSFGSTYTAVATGGTTSSAITYEITGGTGTGTLGGTNNDVLTITKSGTFILKATKAGDDNYRDVESEEFTLTVNKIAGNGGTVSISDWTFGESASNNPSVSGQTSEYSDLTYYYNANKLGDWTTDKPTSAGTHQVKAVFAESDNYLSSTSTVKEFVISPKTLNSGDVTITLTLTNGGIYNGAPHTPTIASIVLNSAVEGSTDLSAVIDYNTTVGYVGDFVNVAGDKTVNVTFVGNFTGTVGKEYTIAKQEYTPVPALASNSHTYGTTLQNWTFAADSLGSWAWTLANDPATTIPTVGNSGYEAEYTLTNGNYQLSGGATTTTQTVVVIVLPKTIYITPTGTLSKDFGADDPTPFGYTTSGWIGSDSQSLLTGQLTRTVGDDVGSYSMLIGSVDFSTPNPNYTLEVVPTDFHILPNDPDMQVSIVSWTYGQYNPVTNAAKVESDTHTTPGDYSIAYYASSDTSFTSPIANIANANAGSYVLRVVFKELGEVTGGTVDVTFTIHKAPAVTQSQIDAASIVLSATYGNTLSTVSFTNMTVPNGISGSWEWVNDAQSVGGLGTKSFAAKFTPADTTNYNAATVNVSVNVAHESVAVPTFSSASTFTYDRAEKTVTLTTSSNEGVAYTVSGTFSATNAGEYTITVSLKVGYSWIGGGSSVIDLTWEIEKAPYIPGTTKPTSPTSHDYETPLSGWAITSNDSAYGTWAWDAVSNDPATTIPTVGNSGFVAKFTPNSNYYVPSGSQANATVRIVVNVTPKEITPSAPTISNGPFAYETPLSSWTLVTDSAYDGIGSWSWSTSANNPATTFPTVGNSGYTAVFTLTNSNYTLSGGANTRTVVVTVTPKTLDDSMFNIPDQVWDGSNAIVFTVTRLVGFKVSGSLLTNTDFTIVTHGTNNALGSGTVTISANGTNYSGTSIVLNFSIVDKPQILEEYFNLSKIVDVMYTGNAFTPNVTLSSTGTPVDFTVNDFEVSYINNVNAGTATVTITGKNNYGGTITKTFEISKSTAGVATVSISNFEWTGSAAVPTVNITKGDWTTETFYFSTTQNGTFTTTAPSAIGTYWVYAVLTDGANYADKTTAKVSFKILHITHTAQVVYNGGTLTFGDAVPAKSDFKVDFGGGSAVAGDFTVQLSTGTALVAGNNTFNWTFTPSDSNYETKSGTVIVYVSKANGSGATVSITGWVYGESANAPTVSGQQSEYGTPSFVYSSNGTDWSTTVPTDAGSYQVKAEFGMTTNYNAYTTSAASFVIAKANRVDPAIDAKVTKFTISVQKVDGATITISDDTIVGVEEAGRVVFKGLEAGTEYTISIAYAETNNYNAKAKATWGTAKTIVDVKPNPPVDDGTDEVADIPDDIFDDYVLGEDLPEPDILDDGFEFGGWYDENGEQVTSLDNPEQADNLTPKIDLKTPTVVVEEQEENNDGTILLKATVTNRSDKITYGFQWYEWVPDANASLEIGGVTGEWKAVEGAMDETFLASLSGRYTCKVTASFGSLNKESDYAAWFEIEIRPLISLTWLWILIGGVVGVNGIVLGWKFVFKKKQNDDEFEAETV